MTYKTPLDDIFFNLRDMGLLEQVLALPGYEEISDDIVDAVLHENAKFVQEVVAPTNRDGDHQAPNGTTVK